MTGVQTCALPICFAAGGGTDVSGRLFAERLRGLYAPNVVVENKVGAGGRLGNELVKNAPPDGSVMLFTPDFTLTIFAVIYKNLSYDPVKDLIAVAPVTKGALVFSVGPQVPSSVTARSANRPGPIGTSRGGADPRQTCTRSLT